ncbi:macro domain-like protein, partial [Suillus subluteus]
MDFPNFILIAPKSRNSSESLCDAWSRAIEEHFPDPNDSPFTVIEGKVQEVDPKRLRCDCVVSPANSFGIMDGGIDYQFSRILKGMGDIWHLTDHCQTYIRDVWHGYIPPGSCMIVPLPDDITSAGNPWDARALAISPTMRVPDDVSWHQDLVYNAMWSLLVQLDRWNKASDAEGHVKIQTVLMTGFGTGTGGIDVDKCAQQMMLAVKHFRMPLADHVRWSSVEQRVRDVLGTIDR